jgi:hypothetical protein
MLFGKGGLSGVHVQPQDANHPVVRLSEVLPAPASNDSHESTNLIRSEETDFGSDISRGAVREGRLYDHKKVEKSFTSKPREQTKPDARSAQDGPTPQRGVLRIQPGKVDQGKPSHRGGLLLIDTKTTNNKTTKPRGNQNSTEFNRNVVLLRKEKDPKPKGVIWNPDNIPSHVTHSQSPTLKPHVGQNYVLTPDDILHEVKSAYQEIQTLERKVKSLYEDVDDMDLPRIQRRPSTDASTWSVYSKTQKEYLPNQQC